ncbi:hypothetical protein GALMADRAFT_146782 [Galerina marginata CBS 339.88]|uniref:Uncharacterized protein n=1 Tax=Galerina marginata (strain CBS 339.88) TaxID=685588 RepID=A0A067SJ36_GALM3|nr:hypothetical protein GALMADRAFT_146782 [Galerina marginata CBS 339.88]
MKRKAEEQPDDIQLKPKSLKIERIIFQKAVLEILRNNSPHDDPMKALKTTSIPNLKHICTEFRLQVGKSGRGKRPACVKKDFIDAIVLRLQSLAIPLLKAEDALNHTQHAESAMDVVNLGCSKDVGTLNSTFSEVGTLLKNSDIMDIDSEPTDAGHYIHVRTFQSRKDFIHHSSVKYPRLPGHGINIQDIEKDLKPAGLYELIDPFNYKPVHIPDMYIDSVIIDLHIKRQGYLRMVFVHEK